MTDDLGKRVRAAVGPSGRAAAVVFSGHITGLAVVRSLGRRGIPTVVLDRSPNGVAFASKHASVTGLVPNPQTHEDEFVERLLEVGEGLEVPGVLFPTNDDWLLAVLRHRRRLERYFRIPVSDLETVERILNKVLLYREARRLGIPIPPSHEVTDDTLASVKAEARFPLILKPVHQRPFYDAFGQKVVRVETPDELDAAYRRTRPHEVVAQEIVPQEHAVFHPVGVYAGQDSRLLGSFVGRKREQYPSGFGTSCLMETADVPEAVERGARLLQALRYRGLAEVEYILDSRDGEYKLIDLNTRAWKWIGLPIASGVDLPHLAYADALGTPYEAPPPRPGLKWVYARDYVRLLAERAQAGAPPTDGLSENEWRALLTGDYGPATGIVEAVHDPDDPGPTVRLVTNLFRADSYYCPC